MKNKILKPSSFHGYKILKNFNQLIEEISKPKKGKTK